MSYFHRLGILTDRQTDPKRTDSCYKAISEKNGSIKKLISDSTHTDDVTGGHEQVTGQSTRLDQTQRLNVTKFQRIRGT